MSKIFAHRGFSGLYPENTLLAFKMACETPGCNGIEMDVQLTRDGECVVNTMPVYQKSRSACNNMLIAQRGFAPVSGVYNYGFSDGGTNDALSMKGVTDMRFKTTFSTANTAGYTLVDVTMRPTGA